MICKANIAVILDTNILLDILQNVGGNDFLRCITGWLRETVEDADCATVENRGITLAVSKKMIKEYKTGIKKRGLDERLLQGLDILVSKGLAMKLRVASKKGDFFLITRKINPKNYRGRGSSHDSKDSKLFALCETVKTMRRLRDREAVIGCRDTKTARGLQKEFSRGLPLMDSITKLRAWINDP